MKLSDIKVGDILPSTKWGDFQIVEIEQYRRITVVFIETGYTVTTKMDKVSSGVIRDKLAELRDKDELSRIGDAQLLGKVIVDYLGFEFVIISRHRNKTWNVRYTESGNTYLRTEKELYINKLTDHIHPPAIEKKASRKKVLDAEGYDRSRERRVEQACRYQRLNAEKVRARNRNRRALKAGAEGTHTIEESHNLLISQGGRCACCDISLTEDNRELDHIMPLILGGSNYIENLQWLCQFCNGSKNASHPDDWAIYSKSPEFKKRREKRLNDCIKKVATSSSDSTQTEQTNDPLVQS